MDFKEESTEAFAEAVKDGPSLVKWIKLFLCLPHLSNILFALALLWCLAGLIYFSNNTVLKEKTLYNDVKTEVLAVSVFNKDNSIEESIPLVTKKDTVFGAPDREASLGSVVLIEVKEDMGTKNDKAKIIVINRK